MDVNGQFTIPSAFKTYLGYNFLFYQKEPRNSIAIPTDKCRTQEHPGIRGILWDYSGTLTSNIGSTSIVGLQWDYSGTMVLSGPTLEKMLAQSISIDGDQMISNCCHEAKHRAATGTCSC